MTWTWTIQLLGIPMTMETPIGCDSEVMSLLPLCQWAAELVVGCLNEKYLICLSQITPRLRRDENLCWFCCSFFNAMCVFRKSWFHSSFWLLYHFCIQKTRHLRVGPSWRSCLDPSWPLRRWAVGCSRWTLVVLCLPASVAKHQLHQAPEQLQSLENRPQSDFFGFQM